jgi:phage terminase large subunit-like protein
VPLNEFRTKRLNQWVTATESYLPRGSWEACEDLERVVDSKEPIVVGFDGSLGHDATAVVGCTVSDPPHLFYLKHWQRPFDADPAWQLDYDDVEDTLRDIWRDFNVKEVVADPHLWEQTLHKLSNDGLTIVEFPQRDERMVRATEGLYQAVVKNSVTHDGNEMLARHMANARTLQTSRGIKLTKATKKSPLKIDLAVAGVMAFGVASVLKPAKKPRIYSMSKLLEGGYT